LPKGYQGKICIIFALYYLPPHSEYSPNFVLKRIDGMKYMAALFLSCLYGQFSLGQPDSKHTPVSHLKWIEARFYKNYSLEMFPWFYGIIPHVYFEPDPAFVAHDETVKEQQFFFTSGETNYTVNPILSSKGYLNNMSGRDARVGFDVSSNGTLVPQSVGANQFNNRNAFIFGPR
jgi:hypothetical protein